MLLASCQRQSTRGACIPGEGTRGFPWEDGEAALRGFVFLFGPPGVATAADEDRLGPWRSSVLGLSTEVWESPSQEYLLYAGCSSVCRLRQSTQRGQAALGIKSYAAVLMERPNAHCHGTSMGSVSSVQFSSCHVWLFVTPWTAACQASLSITNSWSLLKLMSIESVMPSHHLILCHPPLLPPSIFPSIRIFPKESVLCIRWPKYWSLSFSISPSNEHSGLISFRMDWLDLFAVQGTLKSLLQHHSSEHQFFFTQLSL